MKLGYMINVDEAVVNVYTTRTNELKDSIIEAAEEGKLETWSHCHYKGVDYLIHSSDQYENKAFLKFILHENRIEIKLVWPDSSSKETAVKNIYFGMIISSLLTHFNHKFSRIEITD